MRIRFFIAFVLKSENLSSLARQAQASRLMLCLCYFLSSSFIFFFNDRLEQRDLGNYKTDLHQIFNRVVDMLV